MYSFVAWTSIFSYWYFFTTISLSKLNVLFADSQHEQKKRCRPDFLPHLLLSYFFLNYFSSFISSNFFFCVRLFDWLSDRLFGRCQVVLSTRLYTLLETPSSSDYVLSFSLRFLWRLRGGRWRGSAQCDMAIGTSFCCQYLFDFQIF